MIFICIQCAFTCVATVNSVQIQTKLNSIKGTTDKSLSPKERLSNKLIWKFVSSKCQNPWSRWKSIQQIPMQQEIMVKPIALIRFNKNQISFRFCKICVYPFLSSFTNLIISTIIVLYILSFKLRFSSYFTNHIIFLCCVIKSKIFVIFHNSYRSAVRSRVGHCTNGAVVSQENKLIVRFLNKYH